MSSGKRFGWRKNNSSELTQFEIKEHNNQVLLINRRGDVHEVDPLGSLALLALGSIGLKAWRRAKEPT